MSDCDRGQTSTAYRRACIHLLSTEGQHLLKRIDQLFQKQYLTSDRKNALRDLKKHVSFRKQAKYILLYQPKANSAYQRQY